MPPQTIRDLVAERSKYLRFIERRVASRDLAEDILQSAYARAFAAHTPLRSEESSVAWFYRTLRNAIIDHYRHRAVEHRLFDPLASEIEGLEPNPDRARAVCTCIHGAIDRLRPAYKEILHDFGLADDTKVTLNDFAARAGITANNATVRVHRARRALKEELLQTCGDCAQHACLDCTCV